MTLLLSTSIHLKRCLISFDVISSLNNFKAVENSSNDNLKYITKNIRYDYNRNVIAAFHQHTTNNCEQVKSTNPPELSVSNCWKRFLIFVALRGCIPNTNASMPVLQIHNHKRVSLLTMSLIRRNEWMEYLPAQWGSFWVFLHVFNSPGAEFFCEWWGSWW